MTDKTQPEAGSIYIIRYALEMGLLWIDGDGRDKVREALDALDALEAQLSAIGAGGVQALSAAPAGWKLVPVEPTVDQEWAGKNAALRCSTMGEACKIYKAMLAASPPAAQPIGEVVVTKTEYGQIVSVTRQDDEGRILSVIATSDPAEQQAAPKAAPGVGNSGFDHQTAADFLNGKTVSDESVRKFVQASRWAHDEKASLSAMLLSVRGELASREAEIALLKKALMEAEAAPQQEVLDAAFEAVRKKLCALPRYSFVLDDDGLIRRVHYRSGNWIDFDDAHELFDPVAVDAALAAQGGKE